MRPIIFARIADMKYYQGVTEEDIPVNGGLYVEKYQDAHECYNFAPTPLVDGSVKCLGFAMQTTASKTKDPELHIEKIAGCQMMKKAEKVEDVTVVFCSTPKGNWNMRVVGFYKHATVYRQMQRCEFENGDEQWFNFIADAKDCVLLPYQERRCNNTWAIPTSGKNGFDFGFGRSNIWYAKNDDNNEKLTEFVENMLQKIDTYTGENWVEGVE